MTRPWTASAGGPARQHAPATLRNRDAIAAVLREILPPEGSVLEVASGSGEHCAWFARLFPAVEWRPSDPDPAALASIEAWCAGLPNVRPPIALDAVVADWPVTRADAVLCVNMVHISPWAATLGLLAGAARVLPVGGPLYLYEPYRRVRTPTAPSTEAFDRALKARDPRWGLRDLEAVTEAAESAGLRFERLVEMPANNLSVVHRRA